MTAVAVVEKAGVPAVQTSARAVGLLRPIAAPGDVLSAQNETRAMVKAALQEGRDFGTVPGTDKASLLKPGAERVALAFGCYYGTPEILEREVDHDREVKWLKRRKKWRNAHKGDREFTWEEEAGMSFGLYRYVLRVPVINRSSGETVGAGIGSCSTMEAKYVDRPRDSENTVLKMAHKRAVVGAALITFGLSDEFTQDTEDMASNGVIDTSDPAAVEAAAEPHPECPKCKGKMWDNREKKTNPKAPDFKCRDKNCDGVFWPGQWPPKEPEASQTDAFDSSATEKLTRDSVFPRGPFAGKTVRDLPIDFLKWAIGDERNLGDRTPEWQDIFNLELDERAAETRDGKTPVQAAAEAGPGNSAAALEPNPDKPARRPNRGHQAALTDEIPF
jgi:hypothetical protein